MSLKQEVALDELEESKVCLAEAIQSTVSARTLPCWLSAQAPCSRASQPAITLIPGTVNVAAQKRLTLVTLNPGSGGFSRGAAGICVCGGGKMVDPLTPACPGLS